MKVNIKNLGVLMEIKNKGMELEVRNTKDKFLGDLFISKSGLTWCKGKTGRDKGVKLSWTEFIRKMDEL